MDALDMILIQLIVLYIIPSAFQWINDWLCYTEINSLNCWICGFHFFQIVFYLNENIFMLLSNLA